MKIFLPRPESLRAWLGNTLVSGLLVLVPMGATVYVLQAIINTADRVFDIFPEWMTPPLRIPGMGLILAFVVTLVAGVLARNLIGRVVGQAFVSLVSRIPVVAGLYNLFRQISQTFLGGGGKGFKGVVLVEWPRRDTWTIAFVTSELGAREHDMLGHDGAGGPWLSLFVPTTPNPTGGFYFVAKKAEVKPTKLSVEAAFKLILSGGALSVTDE